MDIVLVIRVCIICSVTIAVRTSEPGLETQEGHLKAFGEGRPNRPVEEVNGFPGPKHFFENYVTPMKPVLMKGAAKLSKGYTLWTDEYFLTENSDFKVMSEPSMKQVLFQTMKYITFTEFVSEYKESGHYMINVVPTFLL